MAVAGNQRLDSHYDLGDLQSAFRSEDFHKSQMHLTRPGVWLDIYRPVFAEGRRYLKVTEAEHERCFIVLSFCMGGEAH